LASPSAGRQKKAILQSVLVRRRLSFFGLAYPATYVMRAVVDGKLKAGDASVEAGKLSVVNGSEILLGAPFIFTKANVKDFDF